MKLKESCEMDEYLIVCGTQRFASYFFDALRIFLSQSSIAHKTYKKGCKYEIRIEGVKKTIHIISEGLFYMYRIGFRGSIVSGEYALYCLDELEGINRMDRVELINPQIERNQK